MRRIRQTLLALGLTAVVGSVTMAGGISVQAAHHAASKPIIDAHSFDRLAKLGSYHVESSWTATTGKKTAQSVQFSEDVHRKDYHLTVLASTNATQKSEIYSVKGHLYIGANGQFQDMGTLGQQLAQPILQMTLGFWSGLFIDSNDAHFVGHVTTSGRPANRYRVVLFYSGPGTGTGSGNTNLTSFHFTNTIDLDVATQAPLRIVGSFTGKDDKGVVSTLKDNFLVTRIGKVGAIEVPHS